MPQNWSIFSRNLSLNCRKVTRSRIRVKTIHSIQKKHEFLKTIHKHCYFPDFGREDMALEALWQDINAKNMTKSQVFVSFGCSRLDS